MAHDLTKGPVWKALMGFVLPFLGATVLQFLYSIVDMIVVGRFTDAAGITAVNTSGQIMLIVTSAVQGIATGCTVVIGQYVGRKQYECVKDTIQSMARIVLITSILLITVMITCNGLIIRLTRVPFEAVKPASEYLFICSLGIFFIAGYNGIAGIMRGLGDSVNPMLFQSVSCVANILGDLLLVGALDSGALGAAVATVAAQMLAFALSVFSFQRSTYRIKLCKKHKTPQGKLILKTGVPIAAQDSLTLLSFLLITVIVNSMDAVNKSAAVGVVERLLGFCMLVPTAFLSALSAFTAQNAGAGLKDRTRMGLKLSLFFCGGINLIIFILIEIIPEYFVGLFTADAFIIADGVDYCRSYAADIIGVVFVFCLNGFFSGYGKTRFSMANNLVSTFMVRVPMVYLISLIPNVSLFYIGLAAPCASAIQIIMQIIYYRAVRDWHWDTLAGT